MVPVLKFESFSFIDSTPGGSDVLYQMQYRVSEGVYALIPDSAIPGNSVGTSTSPIDLTNVDINTYGTIRALATLSCGGGSCPEVEEWKVEWSEGSQYVWYAPRIRSHHVCGPVVQFERRLMVRCSVGRQLLWQEMVLGPSIM